MEYLERQRNFNASISYHDLFSQDFEREEEIDLIDYIKDDLMEYAIVDRKELQFILSCIKVAMILNFNM